MNYFVNTGKFEGKFALGLKDGPGIFQSKKGEYFKGEYKNNKRHGFGMETFANGDRYEGSYINGQRNGFGRYFVNINNANKNNV